MRLTVIVVPDGGEEVADCLYSATVAEDCARRVTMA